MQVVGRLRELQDPIKRAKQDLRQALDPANAGKLREILAERGVPDALADLTFTFVTNRKFLVQFRSFEGMVESAEWAQETGVVQGSYLRPLLFLAYTYTLLARLQDEFGDDAVTTFVGDSNAVITASTAEGLRERIARSLQIAEERCGEYHMSLNVGKTKLPPVGVAAAKVDAGTFFRVEVKGEPMISVRKVIKVLGLKFDRSLSFEPHAKDLLESVCARARALSAARLRE